MISFGTVFERSAQLKAVLGLTFNSKGSLKIKDLNKNEKHYFKNYSKQYGCGRSSNCQCSEN